MTTPTQAQVEAAAAQIIANLDAPAFAPIAPKLAQKAAKAALIAAAQAGSITTEQLDKAQFGKVLHDRPAAQVGEQREQGLAMLAEAVRARTFESTIERCAQVAEQVGNHNYEENDPNYQYAEGLDYAATAIAAAIRKLKDEP